MKIKFFPKSHPRIVMIVLSLLAWMGSAVAQNVAPGSQVPDFQLQDQFGKDHKLSEYTSQGKLVLILSWDRSSTASMENWMLGVRKKYPGGPDRVVTLVYVATFKGAPGFMQAGIKEKYQKSSSGQANGAILFDWDGSTVAKMFGFHDDVANVYLVDQKGIFRSSAYGKGTDQDLQPILRDIGTWAANLPKASNSEKSGNKE
jgi:hypothetical protein